MEFTNQEGVSQRLTPSEDPLQLVIDTTPALIHTALPDGSLDFFNRRWLEYVGLSLEEIRGWKWTASIHPEDVERFVEKWRASVESGEPFEAESRVRRADGEYRWFLHRKVPLRDDVGTIVKWYGSSIEVEDGKRAEEIIRRNERELRQQIDSIPQLVCVFDPNGQILQANQMVLNYTGHTLEEFLKEEAAKKSLHPDDLASYGETRRRGISRGLPFENEARLLERGGEYCWFLFRFNPLRDETGNILRWYATATNIEHMKKADEHIRRAVQELQTKQQLLDLAQKAGQPCRIVGFTGEITPRKLVEEELRRSQAHLAEGQRLSQTGSFGWHFSRAELYWSEETFRIFQYDRAIKPTIEQVLERTHPKDRILVQQTIERAQRERKDFEL